MSMQAQLSNDSLKYLPKIYELVHDVRRNFFSRNQMRCYAEMKMMNTIKPITKMSRVEKEKFENSLLMYFGIVGWID